jgi:RNA polymerase sigma-70 factor (ECF subfamily)
LIKRKAHAYLVTTRERINLTGFNVLDLGFKSSRHAGEVMAASRHQVTELLRQWKSGDEEALDKLTPLIYDELHRLAHQFISRERTGHTLQTTALVNEAYLRLVEQNDVDWESRAHFFAVSAQVMRHILVDYARQHAAAKRGGQIQRVTLDGEVIVSRERAAELVALDEAMQALHEIYPRRSKVVELRYFGGLNNKEASQVLKVSEATIERDWRFAKAWLYRELQAR